MTSLYKLSVVGFIGSPFAVAEKDADLLRLELIERLSAGQKVVLDFDGIDMLTTSFINPAIGMLYGSTLTPDRIDALLEFEGVYEEDLERINRAKVRGKEHRAHPELFEGVEVDAVPI